MKKAVKHVKSIFRTIAELDYQKKGLLALFVVAVIIALFIRYRLVGVVTPDFTDFLGPWIQHMSQYGIAGLGMDFSNYNTPYLVLLWAASFLPFSDLMSVKLISILFDLVLAVAVFLAVRHFRPKGIVPYISFLAILFAPTVIQNGSMWGQCDSIYTSFIVFAFYAYLKKRLSLAWILWGVAFAFKLQAIFFAPFLIFLTLYHRRAWFGPIWAGLTTFLLSALPLVFGKSFKDTFSTYIGQTAPPRSDWGLAWFAPTAYQWVSNAYFAFVRNAGVLFGAAVALGCIALAFLRKYNEATILAIATFTLLVVPFFLPTIHERYLFAGEIFLIISASVIPRFVWAAIAMQIITTMTYLTYFTQGNEQPPIPFAILSLGVFAIICALGVYIYQTSSSLSPNYRRSSSKK